MTASTDYDLWTSIGTVSAVLVALAQVAVAIVLSIKRRRLVLPTLCYCDCTLHAVKVEF